MTFDRPIGLERHATHPSNVVPLRADPGIPLAEVQASMDRLNERVDWRVVFLGLRPEVG